MVVIIAGSRTVSDGWVRVIEGGRIVTRFDAAVAGHNGKVLDEAVRQSGLHTQVVNLHAYKGPHMPVCRGTQWGNPFTHLTGNTRAEVRVATRAEAIDHYREWFMEQPELIERLPELRGKVLGCWCKPASCHGDFLAECAGRIDKVVSGTAHGADTLGEAWAGRNGVPVVRMPADWSIGRQAGYLRNAAMAKVADAAIVLWAARSRGSGHMIDLMAAQGKPCYVQNVRVERNLTYAV